MYGAKKALIIGLGNYPTAPLKGAISDAHSVHSVLQSNSDGSPNFDCKLITDECSKVGLKAAIRELFEGENDVALLYFSGHGVVTSTGGYAQLLLRQVGMPRGGGGLPQYVFHCAADAAVTVRGKYASVTYCQLILC